LWADFEQARIEEATRGGRPAPTPARRLTHVGFAVRGPRVLPARAGEPAAILYSSADQHDFPALYAIEPDSGGTRRLATRVAGDLAGVGRDTIVFDQLEVVRNVAVQSDLYAIDRASGETRRVTHDERAIDPDLSPDGRTVACVVNQNGARALATIDLASPGAPVILAAEPETQFAAPRWSPDGRTIAVERLRLGGVSEIVLVDVASRAVRPLVAWPDARNTSPAWMPDSRTLLFASARGREPFDIVAVDVEGALNPRQVASTRWGAMSPDVSPDGRLLVYVGYTSDGYDLFTTRLDREAWARVDIPATAPVTPPVVMAPTPTGGDAYRPFPTILPRAWFPVLEGDEFQTRLGAQTDGTDVLGRHGFAALASWWITGERRPLLQDAGRPNWAVSYAYTRWRPSFFVSASEADTLYPLARSAQGRTTELLERHASTGVALPFVRMRSAQTLLAAINYERDTALNGPRRAEFERSAFRGAWAFANAKHYGYSISAEQGVVVGVTSEHVRRAIGADGDADAGTIDARAYLRAGPRHGVLALRMAAGAATGDDNVRRTFDLGGSDARLTLFDFSRDALSLLRGFEPGAFSGSRIVNANLEYRAPIWRVERGHGTLPLFARTLHGAVFADLGHAWTRSFSARDLKSSVGVEAAADLVIGYFVPFTLAGGAALGRDGASGITHPRYYLRIGRAF
jgi:hypothetical protein